MRGMLKEMKWERDAGLDFILRVLGSYWEVGNRAMASSGIIPIHDRRIPLTAVRAREEAKRLVRGSMIQDKDDGG